MTKLKETVYEKKSLVGRMVLLESFLLFLPIVLALFYPKEQSVVWIFALPAGCSVVFGAILCRVGFNISSSSRQVLFFWLYGMLLAAVPFYLFGGITPVQALFEAVSGFTTTGLSVLEVEQLPRMLLFYRALLQYVGGIGFVVTMLLFVQEKESAELFQTEGHPDRLMPAMGKTARAIGIMYVFFLLAGTGLYCIAGMSAFDGIVHAMCSLSTGGFSNRMDSIGYYNSFSMEAVTILLMLTGTTNFSFLLLLFRGKLREFAKASELRFLAGLVLLAVPVMSACLIMNGEEIVKSIRLAAFNMISAISTTGYATCSYNDWPETALVIMILMMIIGGGMGSTAGGIKLARVCILCKDLVRNVQKKLLPNRAVLLTYYHRGTERELLGRERVEEASTYAGAYLVLYLAGTLCLMGSSGCSLLQGAFEFASALGTVGLSIGITNAQANAGTLWIEMIGMILGRLEIFVILKAFYVRSAV